MGNTPVKQAMSTVKVRLKRARDGLFKSKLEKRLESVLQGAQKREQRFKTIESIMLKFTKVQQGTMLARDLFFSFDVDNSKTINIHEFCESISKLQATEQTGTESTSEQKLPMGLVRDIFQESDVDKNHELNFHEFILMLAIMHLLEIITCVDGSPLAEINHALDIIIDAFLFFDNDSSGTISEKEVREALSSSRSESSFATGTHSDSFVDEATAHERYAEMSSEGGGDVIRFSQFLLQFLEWALVDEKDEDSAMDYE